MKFLPKNLPHLWRQQVRLPQTAIAWTVELNKPKYNEVNETTGTCENFASNPILTKRVLGPDSVKA